MGSSRYRGATQGVLVIYYHRCRAALSSRFLTAAGRGSSASAAPGHTCRSTSALGPFFRLAGSVSPLGEGGAGPARLCPATRPAPLRRLPNRSPSAQRPLAVACAPALGRPSCGATPTAAPQFFSGARVSRPPSRLSVGPRAYPKPTPGHGPRTPLLGWWPFSQAGEEPRPAPGRAEPGREAPFPAGPERRALPEAGTHVPGRARGRFRGPGGWCLSGAGWAEPGRGRDGQGADLQARPRRPRGRAGAWQEGSSEEKQEEILEKPRARSEQDTGLRPRSRRGPTSEGAGGLFPQLEGAAAGEV